MWCIYIDKILIDRQINSLLNVEIEQCGIRKNKIDKW